MDLWIYNILYNNNLTSSYINIPVKPSEKWRCKDSVVELLFNETFDPSGKMYDNFPYIYRYKTVNIKKIESFDVDLHRRIQIYPYKYVWCADDESNTLFQDIQNQVIPIFTNNTSDSTNYYNGINPTKYITKYRSAIITSTNDQLHADLPDTEDEDDNTDQTVYGPDVNVFGLTKEELEMCQLLYYYRTGQFELIHCFTDDFYYQLRSPLSKWIYLYLQCYLFNIVNYKYLNTITTEDDGILRCMFEKHAQDRIYQYIQKQNFAIWNKVEDIGGNSLRRIFEDYTMNCHTFIWTKRIDKNIINNKEIAILLEEEQQPVNNSNFEFIYDGKQLKQNIDFEIVNKGNLKDPKTYIIFKKMDNIKENIKYQLMWSALTLTTPLTRNFYSARQV